MTDIFQNLTEQELAQAQQWFSHLREPEQPRVAETLKALHRYPFKLHGFPGTTSDDEVAIMAAGSSIDTGTYTDIDLFLLTRTSLAETYDPEKLLGNRSTAPHTAIGVAHMMGKLGIPEHVALVQYKSSQFRDEEEAHREISPRELVDSGQGALVTVSLFYDLVGFEKPREGKSNDLIEPFPQLGAEEIIAYNSERGAKFLVLDRQYELK